MCSRIERNILPEWTIKHNYTSVLIFFKKEERKKDIFVPIFQRRDQNPFFFHTGPDLSTE